MRTAELSYSDAQTTCTSFTKSPDSERALRLADGSCPQRQAVRMVRKVEPDQTPTQAGRMLLSGRIGDICEQIDTLIAQEPAQGELWSQPVLN